MRPVLTLASVVILILFALPLSAQNWSPEQRDLIDHVQRCWDTFQEGFDAWQEVCPPAENRVFWITSDDVPKTDWSNFEESIQYTLDNEETLFLELRPLHVAMHGDVATYAYWVFYAVRDADGQHIAHTEKRLEAFRRVGGQWLFIAGMATPGN